MVLRQSVFERVGSYFVIALLVCICLITVYPFLYVTLYSISDGTAASATTITFYPIKPTLMNFKTVFENSGIMHTFFISVARTISGTLLHLMVTTMAAYALSKRNLKWRKQIVPFFLIPMYFNGGLLPFYVVIVKLGLNNSFLVYILPGIMGIFNMLLAKVYFEQLPASLEESARIDGAGDIAVFFKIVLPSSLPILATISLFAGVAQWNSWFDALLFVTKQDLMPLQTLLYKIILESQATTIEQIMRMSHNSSNTTTPEAIKMTTLIFATIPILVVYPFMQRFFVKGMMLGAIKG